MSYTRISIGEISKAEAKRPLSNFFCFLCYFPYSTVVRFSVFVLITTNLMVREIEKEEKKKYSRCFFDSGLKSREGHGCQSTKPPSLEDEKDGNCWPHSKKERRVKTKEIRRWAKCNTYAFAKAWFLFPFYFSSLFEISRYIHPKRITPSFQSSTPHPLITRIPHHLVYPGMAPARYRNRDTRTEYCYPRSDRLYLSKQRSLSVAIFAQCWSRCHCS